MYDGRGALAGERGEHEKEARFHASLGQTGEKSTWWHMARKDAKDLYEMFCLCKSTNLLSYLFIGHVLQNPHALHFLFV